jgi:hypothetical protein
MTRKIELEIEGAKALAVMLDDLTPNACNTIWSKLPLEGPAIMAKWACREIMLHLTGDMQIKLEPEGPRRMFTVPGDIGYLLRGPSLLGAQKEYESEFKRSLCEFTIYYGLATLEYPSMTDPGRTMDKDKWGIKATSPWVNFKWARLEHPIPRDFYLKCESIRHGRKKISITRYDS